MAEYYDLILGLIPLALFGISGTLTLGGLSSTFSVTAAGIVAVLLVGHALFVRGPVDSDPMAATAGDEGPAVGPERAPMAD